MRKAKILDYYNTFGEWSKNDPTKAIYVPSLCLIIKGIKDGHLFYCDGKRSRMVLNVLSVNIFFPVLTRSTIYFLSPSYLQRNQNCPQL